MHYTNTVHTNMIKFWRWQSSLRNKLSFTSRYTSGIPILFNAAYSVDSRQVMVAITGIGYFISVDKSNLVSKQSSFVWSSRWCLTNTCSTENSNRYSIRKTLESYRWITSPSVWSLYYLQSFCRVFYPRDDRFRRLRIPAFYRQNAFKLIIFCLSPFSFSFPFLKLS